MCFGVYEAEHNQLFIEANIGIGSPTYSEARTIRFLIDTGATSTMLSAVEAIRLGITYNRRGQPSWQGEALPYIGEALGVGGNLKLYGLSKTFVTLISHEPSYGERHTEHIARLLVAEKKYQDESLLGMDLIKRFNLLIDSEDTVVNFTRIPVRGTSYLVEHA